VVVEALPSDTGPGGAVIIRRTGGRLDVDAGRPRIALLTDVVTSLAWSSETAAVCQLAPPDDVLTCASDSSGTCCLVQHDHGEGQCLVGYCMDFNTCAWELIIHLGFS
jgi:hypothetical protein